MTLTETDAESQSLPIDLAQTTAATTTKLEVEKKSSAIVHDSDDDDDVFARFASICGTSTKNHRTIKKPKIKIILKSQQKESKKTEQIPSSPSRTQRSPKRLNASDTTAATTTVPDGDKKSHSTENLGDDNTNSKHDNNDINNDRDTYYDDEDDYYMYDQDTSISAEIEDCYKFLEETHEEQDPQWISEQNKKVRDQIQKQLKEIDDLDIQQRKEIDLIVKQQMSEKQKQIEMTLKKFRVRLNQERTNRIGRIEQWYRQKAASDNQKVAQGLQILQTKHQKDVQAAMQQHRHWQQQQQQRGMMMSDAAQAQAAAEWQQTMNQLQQKHQQQVQDFQAKGADAQTKTESDYRRDREKVRQESESKLAEIEANKTKLLQRQQTAAQQSRQRCLRRQLLKVMQQRKVLFNKLSEVAPKRASLVDTATTLTTTTTTTSDNNAASEHTRRSTYDETKHSRLLTLSPSVTSPRKLVKLLNLDGIGSEAVHFDGTNPSSAISTTDGKDNDNPFGPMISRPDWLLEYISYRNEKNSEHTTEADELGLLGDDNNNSCGSDIAWELSGAHNRVQHRRAIMSTAVRQVTVEIHNEGILVSIINNDSKDDDKRDSSSRNNDKLNNDSENGYLGSISSSESNREFIFWGVKAFSFLESIVCGEIPMGYKRLFDRLSKDTIAYHGGQVRCVLLDLRTSDESASVERGVSLQEFEELYLQDLKKCVKEMTRFSYDADKVAISAEARIQEQLKVLESVRRDVDRTKHMQEEFRIKFRSYFDPDGNPLPQSNPTDHQHLLNEVMRHENEVESAKSKENIANQTLEEQQAKLQKAQAAAKKSKLVASRAKEKIQQRHEAGLYPLQDGKSVSISNDVGCIDSHPSSFWVKDVTGAIKRAADKRREQATSKGSSSSNNTWLQSLPPLPNALKKYLWYKMHRRKTQIILRPSEELLVDDMKAFLHESIQSSQKRQPTEDELLEAERVLLLGMHPLAEESLPSIPPSRSNERWAEPGWKLILDVPSCIGADDEASRILPMAKSFPVLERNLAEIASSSGRQAASFINSTNLRSLMSPLSTFAKACSPAEVSSVSAEKGVVSESDPLNISKENMDMGYIFSYDASFSRPIRQSRKGQEKLNSGDSVEVSGQTADRSTPTRSVSQGDKKKVETKKRRPSKTVTNASPRSVRLKKNTDEVTMTQIPTSFNTLTSQQSSSSHQPPIMQQTQEQQQSLEHQRRQQKLKSSIQQQQQQQQQQQEQEHFLAQLQQKQQLQQQQNQLASQPQMMQQSTQAQILQQQKRQQQVSQLQLTQQQQLNQQQLQQNFHNQAQRSQQQQQPSQQRNPFQQPTQHSQRLQQQQQMQQLQQQQAQPQQHTQHQTSRHQQIQYNQAYGNQNRQGHMNSNQQSQNPIQGSQQQQQQQQQQQSQLHNPQQRYSASQMAQFLMMQQHSQSPNSTNQQMPPIRGNFPQQALQQQINPFYGNALPHPNATGMGFLPQQQQQQQQQRQQRQVFQHGMPGSSPTGQQQSNQQGTNNDQNDPLFLLK